MNNPSRTPREVRFDNLARVVRDWADHHQEDVPAPEWLTDMGSPTGSSTRSRSGLVNPQGGWSGRRPLLNLTAAIAVPVVALMILRGFGTFDRRIRFLVLEGGTPSQSVEATAGRVTSTERPARLSFSDGSDVMLQPRARGTVVDTTARGAHVRLEEGRARFTVAHRAQTDWTVAAGPFVVIVHGTVFDVSWSAENDALAVDLLEGAITVQGPWSKVEATPTTAPTVSGGTITLQAGQRLTARASTGEARVAPIVSAAIADPVRARSASAVDAEITQRDAQAAPAVGAALQGSRRSSASGVGPEPRQQPTAGATRKLKFNSNGHPTTRFALGMEDLAATWPARVGSGSFESVLADADAIGIERCLSQAPAQSLSALADAARYARRTDLARRALLAERRRFSGSTNARDAAFLIGRLAEDAAGDTREALAWYDRYLEEDERGTYAAEALGRKMAGLARLGETADARSTAEQYLEVYPHGAFANRARRIQESR